LVLQQLQQLVLLVPVVVAVVAVVAEAASQAATNDYDGSHGDGRSADSSSSKSTATTTTASTSGPTRTNYIAGYDPSDPSLTDTCDGNGGMMMLGDMLCYSWPNILYVVLLLISLVMYVATGVFHDLANGFRV
jgi:hypothetical protein